MAAGSGPFIQKSMNFRVFVKRITLNGQDQARLDKSLGKE